MKIAKNIQALNVVCIKKKCHMTLRFLIIELFFLTAFLTAQQPISPKVSPMESFEDGVPPDIEVLHGKISITKDKFKHSNHSLKWDWKGNDKLILKREIYYTPRQVMKTVRVNDKRYKLLEKPRGFFMWIYNSHASPQRLRFQFGKDSKVDCEFDYNINFTGWRTVYIIYDFGDMRGRAQENMNRLTILAPNIGKGTFYIDMLGTSLPMNERNNAANAQLPKIDHHPRLVTQYAQRLLEWSYYRPTFPLKAVSRQDKKDFRSMEEKADRMLLGIKIKKISEKKYSQIINRFNSFKIKRANEETENIKRIDGISVVKGGLAGEYFKGGVWDHSKGFTNKINYDKASLTKNIIGLRQYGDFLNQIAVSYRMIENAQQKKTLASIYIDMWKHMIEQGFDVGTRLGWAHHYPYVIRGIYRSTFLMRDVLWQDNFMETIIPIMKWNYGFGRVYNEEVVYGVKGRKSVDADTAMITPSRLLTALLQKDTPEKKRDLKHFTSYISHINLAYANGLDETFKADGSFFHHAHMAMGYGGRAIEGSAKVIDILANTQYKITKPALDRFKKALKTWTMMWSYGLNGRTSKTEDDTRFDTKTLPRNQVYQLATIALADKKSIDKELAGIFLNQISRYDKPTDMEKYYVDLLKRKGYTNLMAYHKARVLPYGARFVKKNGNQWSLHIRTHSKYTYPFESWTPDRFSFPLYIANGYMEVAYKHDSDSINRNLVSVQSRRTAPWGEGYHWRNWPGTTTVKLPYHKMVTTPIEVRSEGGEYLFSDKAFVGGVETPWNDGLYTFDFRGHHKYGLESFTGKKSWFIFNDLVICLGSDITSKTSEAVETTLAQTRLLSSKEKIYINSDTPSTDFPIYIKDLENNSFFIDPRGTGYYIPSGKGISLRKSIQNTPNFVNKTNAEGTFLTVIKHHGITPKKASYHYAMQIDTDSHKMNQFATAMLSPKPIYSVLQNDEKAHIVKYHPSNITSYVIFNKNGISSSNQNIITSVNRACTLMVKKKDKALTLCLSDPDLNIYDGQEDLMPNGNRKELSLYEREWFFWPSRKRNLKIKLKGLWKINKKENPSIQIQSSNKETILFTMTKNGKTIVINLKKKNNKLR